MGETTVDERQYEWVVAVPLKRNYLSHLVAIGNDPGWATRSVKTLCGFVGFATGTTADADSHRDKDGFRVSRRHCKRCEAKAGADRSDRG